MICDSLKGTTPFAPLLLKTCDRMGVLLFPHVSTLIPPTVTKLKPPNAPAAAAALLHCRAAFFFFPPPLKSKDLTCLHRLRESSHWTLPLQEQRRSQARSSRRYYTSCSLWHGVQALKGLWSIWQLSVEEEEEDSVKSLPSVVFFFSPLSLLQPRRGRASLIFWVRSPVCLRALGLWVAL